MFALFFSLYYSMFTGTWSNFAYGSIFQPGNSLNARFVSMFNALGKLATSIFGDNTYDAFGTDIFNNDNLIMLAALVLALITSIGIVVMAVKGIKRVFGVFFMGIRR